MLTDIDKVRLKSLTIIAENCSEDRETQVGVLLVCVDGTQIEVGNELPLGIEENERRCTKPAKYNYIEHAERTAIAEAARIGISTDGSSLYMSWYPCADCVKAILNAGISNLFCQPHTADFASITRYNFAEAREMLIESNINLIPWRDGDL